MKCAPTKKMIRALRAILAAGGAVQPVGDGLWGTADGAPLEIEADDRRLPITTSTIRALENRGMLALMHLTRHTWQDGRRITDVGRRAIEDFAIGDRRRVRA